MAGYRHSHDRMCEQIEDAKLAIDLLHDVHTKAVNMHA